MNTAVETPNGVIGLAEIERFRDIEQPYRLGDPTRDILRVDNSAITEFGCPQRYFNKIVRGLKKKDKGHDLPLAYGSAWHKALEWRGKPVPADVAGEVGHLQWATGVFLNSYKVVDPPLTDDKHSLDNGVAHLAGYWDKWEIDDTTFEIVMWEQGFQFALSKDVLYCGKIDKTIRFLSVPETSPLHRAIQEHKTSSFNLGQQCWDPHGQVEGYMVASLMAYERGGPQPYYCAQIDYAQKLKVMKKYNDGTAYDRPITTRTPERLDRWATSVIQLCDLIRSCDNVGVWPQQTARCRDFFRDCEYMDICQSNNPEAVREADYEVDFWEPFEV